MAGDLSVLEVVDELDPRPAVLMYPGRVSERKPQSFRLGREEFDLADRVTYAGRLEEGPILVQRVRAVEEQVIMAASRWRRDDEELAWIARVDPEAAEGLLDMATAINERRCTPAALAIRIDVEAVEEARGQAPCPEPLRLQNRGSPAGEEVSCDVTPVEWDDLQLGPIPVISTDQGDDGSGPAKGEEVQELVQSGFGCLGRRVVVEDGQLVKP